MPQSSSVSSFSHEAMTTTFSIRVVHEDRRYAGQAAAAAFEELDRLETQLSRFVEGSDVWRINRLGRGQAVVVAWETFRCLAAAEEVCRRTGGAFDAGYASATRAPPGERLELTAAGCLVRALVEGVQLDFGGIGKGFALDEMAGVLREWEVTAALLAASSSTVLAIDPPPGEAGWAVGLGHEPGRWELVQAAVSGSGTVVKGAHIFDPRSGEPARQWVRAWAQAPTASEADALSTAFMVMSWEQVQKYCGEHPGIRGWVRADWEGPLRAWPAGAGLAGGGPCRARENGVRSGEAGL